MRLSKFILNIVGWDPPLEFITLVKYLKEYGLRLSTAKNTADKILEGESVNLGFSSKIYATDSMRKLTKTGCVCKLTKE